MLEAAAALVRGQSRGAAVLTSSVFLQQSLLSSDFWVSLNCILQAQLC